eukprot:38567-Pleurochrysis_carterae.AAC.1
MQIQKKDERCKYRRRTKDALGRMSDIMREPGAGQDQSSPSHDELRDPAHSSKKRGGPGLTALDTSSEKGAWMLVSTDALARVQPRLRAPRRERRRLRTTARVRLRGGTAPPPESDATTRFVFGWSGNIPKILETIHNHPTVDMPN